MRDAKTTRDAKHRALAEGKGEGLRNTYLVEAGAGTGKTTVLVTRILSLVSEGVRLPKIVAITFTEKAAGELRARLRGDLEKLIRGDGDGELSDSDRARFEEALHEIDRARVGTIHGFCSEILRERPVEAGIDPDFAMADELRQTFLFEEVWDEWIRGRFAEELPDAVAEAHALGFGLTKIRKLARRLISFRDLLDLVPAPLEPGGVEEYIADLKSEARAFTELAREHCTADSDSALGLIAAFVAEVEAIDHVPSETRVAYALKEVKPAPPKNRGKKDNWTDGVLEEVRNRAAALRDRREDLAADLAHNAAVELLGWLGEFVQAYEAAKSRAGVLDFEDLLIKARNLLRDRMDVREHFKSAFERILVDEFQDTDPLQCEIVFYLAEKKGKKASDWREVELEPGRLFLVGDPKQSIYRFRRADIEMYEEAKRYTGDGELLELVENFRTRPAIVEEVNAVFEGNMEPPEGERRYQPEYAPLVAHRDVDGKGPGVVLLFPDEPIEKGTKVGAVRDAEAAAVAGFLASVKNDASLEVFGTDRAEPGVRRWRPVELRDVAILFHSLTGLDAYEQALADFGIDYRIAGGKKFYARREVNELKTVLAAIEDPHNGAAVVGALRSPFLGASDEEILLHRWRAGSLNYLSRAESGVAAVDESFELLRSLHADRNAKGAARLIESLFDETKALELFLMKPSGEQRHANLLKVVELARALERSEALSFGGFVRWLREVSQLTPEEAESPLSEEGDDFVRVLTIHKAKGLEFPVTVLADLGRHRNHGERIVIDRASGRLEFGVGKGGGLATRGYEELHELEKRRRDAELLRLLYVGMTRPRDALVIPWFAAETGRSSTWFLDQLSPLLDRAGDPVRELPRGDGSPTIVAFDSGALELERQRRHPIRLDVEKAAAIDPAGTASERARAEWSERLDLLREERSHPADIRSPSRLDDDREVPGRRRDHGAGRPEDRAASRAADRTQSRARKSDGVDGRELGTLVHDVMETIDFDALRDVPVVTRALAKARGADAATTVVAEELVTAALGSSVIERARSSGRFWRELPFCLASGDTVLEGKMDLVFEEDDGLVVVDYKTDAPGVGGTRELAERYELQTTAYGLSLASVTGRCVKEVVLLFMRGPTEERIDVSDACRSADDARKALEELLGRWQEPPR